MDIEFINLLSSIKGLDYTDLWSFFLLGIIRFIPIVTLAPFLGAKIIPGTARIAFVLIFALLFLPTIILTSSTKTIQFGSGFVGLSLKELLIGFFLGFFTAIPFYMAQTAGITIDFMRGSSQLMAQDPALQSQASPIGILYNYVLIIIFYQIDGPLLFFDAIGQSYELVPIDKFMHPDFFHLQNPFWKLATDLLNRIFTIGIQIAAPSIVAILMAEMFLGIANRMAPQVQIAFLGMPLKSLLGLSLLWAGWFFILKQMEKISINWLDSMQNALRYIPLLNK